MRGLGGVAFWPDREIEEALSTFRATYSAAWGFAPILPDSVANSHAFLSPVMVRSERYVIAPINRPSLAANGDIALGRCGRQIAQERTPFCIQFPGYRSAADLSSTP